MEKAQEAVSKVMESLGSNQSPGSTTELEPPLKSDLPEEIERSVYRGMEHLGVSKIFLEAKLGDFPKPLAGTVLGALTAGRGLFITGLPGRGKTHLAAAVLRVVMLEIYNQTGRWRSVFFRHANDMLLDIKRSFSPGSETSEDDMIERFSYPDVLVLDDLGVAKSTEWVVQTIDTIIDRRYRGQKITVITSNLALSDIGKRLDDRIASRIAGMCEIVELAGEDRRMREAADRKADTSDKQGRE